ncbi:MAG TPA: hypothetical protein VNR40_02190 [Steroidobacter sp.]|nr:hypothetical protein [Steroidobacter sp.]
MLGMRGICIGHITRCRQVIGKNTPDFGKLRIERRCAAYRTHRLLVVSTSGQRYSMLEVSHREIRFDFDELLQSSYRGSVVTDHPIRDTHDQHRDRMPGEPIQHKFCDGERFGGSAPE